MVEGRIVRGESTANGFLVQLDEHAKSLLLKNKSHIDLLLNRTHLHKKAEVTEKKQQGERTKVPREMYQPL